MVWALTVFFIFITVVFLVIALAFPEWVGITGKKALDIQKHQSTDASSESSEKLTNEPASSSPSTEKKLQ